MRKPASWATYGSSAYKPYTKIRRQSQTHELLEVIDQLERSFSNIGGAPYTDIVWKFKYDGGHNVDKHSTTQGIDRTLRRLERSKLITRPERGRYKLTAKGKAALWDFQRGEKEWRF